jgi:hypothetical protein
MCRCGCIAGVDVHITTPPALAPAQSLQWVLHGMKCTNYGKSLMKGVSVFCTGELQGGKDRAFQF